MDQVFRIALCVCLCLGGLQATPVRSTREEPSCIIKKADMSFGLLEGVTCKNLTLSSPTDFEPECYHAALGHYTEQLTLAHNNCANSEYILDGLEALERCTFQQQANCNLTLSAHNTFTSFKSALETFVEELSE